MGIGCDITGESFTSLSSHNSEARGLKIKMHIPHMDGSKVTDQIFGNLLEAEIFKFKVLYLYL